MRSPLSLRPSSNTYNLFRSVCCQNLFIRTTMVMRPLPLPPPSPPLSSHFYNISHFIYPFALCDTMLTYSSMTALLVITSINSIDSLISNTHTHLKPTDIRHNTRLTRARAKKTHEAEIEWMNNNKNNHRESRGKRKYPLCRRCCVQIEKFDEREKSTREKKKNVRLQEWQRFLFVGS